MNNALEKMHTYVSQIILISLISAYFIFQSLEVGDNIFDIIFTFQNIIQTIFVIVSNVITANIGYDKGLEKALEHPDFKEADIINNEIISYVNNNFEKTIDYINYINKNETRIVEQDFLYGLGKVSKDDLTKKELKKMKKLKPKQYTGAGINLPLYHEFESGKKQSFDTSFEANKHKAWRLTKKALTGLIFAFMTFEVVFVWNNIGQALAATAILTAGMLATYFINYNAPLVKLTKTLPKKVNNKENFYRGMLEHYKQQRKTVIDEGL